MIYKNIYIFQKDDIDWCIDTEDFNKEGFENLGLATLDEINGWPDVFRDIVIKCKDGFFKWYEGYDYNTTLNELEHVCEYLPVKWNDKLNDFEIVNRRAKELEEIENEERCQQIIEENKKMLLKALGLKSIKKFNKEDELFEVYEKIDKMSGCDGYWNCDTLFFHGIAEILLSEYRGKVNEIIKEMECIHKENKQSDIDEVFLLAINRYKTI
ncbi:hypothetical protein LPY66_02805 [Dehalobacter sp. DCM]|uniref:hypothetical protein n=1 Tax=Dehalobacter sp. DCM TaxID=2907827 RepID=UPI003081A718|nr:hypothetical protein LPY66_02805 [Dehalobacter sp. DCM]